MGRTIKKRTRRRKKTKIKYSSVNKRTINKYKKSNTRYNKRTNRRKTRRKNKRTLNNKDYYLIDHQDGGAGLKRKAGNFYRKGKALVKGVLRLPTNLYDKIYEQGAIANDLFWIGKALNELHRLTTRKLGIAESANEKDFRLLAMPYNLTKFIFNLGFYTEGEKRYSVMTLLDMLKEKHGEKYDSVNVMTNLVQTVLNLPPNIMAQFFDPDIVQKRIDTGEMIGERKTPVNDLFKILFDIWPSDSSQHKVAKLATPFKIIFGTGVVAGLLTFFGVISTSFWPILSVLLVEGSGLFMGFDFFRNLGKVEGMVNAPQFTSFYSGKFIENMKKNIPSDTKELLREYISEKYDRNPPDIKELTEEDPMETKEDKVEALMNTAYISACLRTVFEEAVTPKVILDYLEKAGENIESDAGGSWDEYIATSIDGASPMLISSIFRGISSMWFKTQLVRDLQTEADFNKNPDMGSYQRLLSKGVFGAVTGKKSFVPFLAYNANILGISDNAGFLRVNLRNNYTGRFINTEFKYYKLREIIPENKTVEQGGGSGSRGRSRERRRRTTRARSLSQTGRVRSRDLVSEQEVDPAELLEELRVNGVSDEAMTVALLSVSKSKSKSRSRSRSTGSRGRPRRADTVPDIVPTRMVDEGEDNNSLLEVLSDYTTHEQLKYLLDQVQEEGCSTFIEAMGLINDLIDSLVYLKYTGQFWSHELYEDNSRVLMMILNMIKKPIPDSRFLGLADIHKVKSQELEEQYNIIFKRVGLNKVFHGGRGYERNKEFVISYDKYPYCARQMIASKIFCLGRLIYLYSNEDNNPELAKAIRREPSDQTPLCCLNEYGIMNNCLRTLSEIIPELHDSCCAIPNNLGLFEIYDGESDTPSGDNFSFVNQQKQFNNLNGLRNVKCRFTAKKPDKIPTNEEYIVPLLEIEVPSSVDMIGHVYYDLTVNTLFEQQTNNHFINLYIDKLIESRQVFNDSDGKTDTDSLNIMNGLFVADNIIALQALTKLSNYSDLNLGMKIRLDFSKLAEKYEKDSKPQKKRKGKGKSVRSLKKGGSVGKPMDVEQRSDLYRDEDEFDAIPAQEEEIQDYDDDEFDPIPAQEEDIQGDVNPILVQEGEIQGDDDDDDDDEFDQIPGQEGENVEDKYKRISKGAENDHFDMGDTDNPEDEKNTKYRALCNIENNKEHLYNDRKETLIEEIVNMLFERPSNGYNDIDMESIDRLKHANHYGSPAVLNYPWGEFAPRQNEEIGIDDDNNVKRKLLSTDLVSCATLYSSLCPTDPTEKMGDLLDRLSVDCNTSCYTSDKLLHTVRIDDCKFNYGRESTTTRAVAGRILKDPSVGVPDLNEGNLTPDELMIKIAQINEARSIARNKWCEFFIGNQAGLLKVDLEKKEEKKEEEEEENQRGGLIGGRGRAGGDAVLSPILLKEIVNKVDNINTELLDNKIGNLRGEVEGEMEALDINKENIPIIVHLYAGMDPSKSDNIPELGTSSGALTKTDASVAPDSETEISPIRSRLQEDRENEEKKRQLKLLTIIYYALKNVPDDLKKLDEDKYKEMETGFKELQKKKILAEDHVSLGIKEGWKVLSYSGRIDNGRNNLILSRMIQLMTGSTGTLMGNLIESLTPTITVDRFYTSTYQPKSDDSDNWPYEYISLPMRFLESLLLIILLDRRSSDNLFDDINKSLFSLRAVYPSIFEEMTTYAEMNTDGSDVSSTQSNPATSPDPPSQRRRGLARSRARQPTLTTSAPGTTNEPEAEYNPVVENIHGVYSNTIEKDCIIRIKGDTQEYVVISVLYREDQGYTYNILPIEGGEVIHVNLDQITGVIYGPPPPSDDFRLSPSTQVPNTQQGMEDQLLMPPPPPRPRRSHSQPHSHSQSRPRSTSPPLGI